MQPLRKVLFGLMALPLAAAAFWVIGTLSLHVVPMLLSFEERHHRTVQLLILMAGVLVPLLLLSVRFLMPLWRKRART
jgi:lysylphosphatidylglycerol synthetase-like protein (DUF2156 family)